MTELKSIFHERPIGKFIALYSDGSGANLFYRDNNGFIYDADGGACSEEYLDDYSEWISLPDTYKLFYEG